MRRTGVQVVSVGADCRMGPRMHRALRVTVRLGRGVLALVVTAVAVGYVAVLVLHLEPMTMLTGSMGDTIPAGSLVLTKSVSPSTVRGGDVITFEKPWDAAGLDTHRVIRIDRSNGHTTYRTQGDANAVADPWVLEFEHNQIAHRVVASVPHAGLLLMSARSPVWVFALVALIALMLLSTMLKVIAGADRNRGANSA
jgi:signal peptidase I